MRPLFMISAIIFATVLLTGCGDEDFTGAYRFDESLVLNIQGKQAKIFFQSNDRVALRSIFNVVVKDDKLFLDSVNDATRIVMKRNLDERSLDCLNCKVIHFKDDDILVKYDPHGPYDVDALLKAQAAKDQEAALKAQELAKKEAEEAAKFTARISTYEGRVSYQVEQCVQKGMSRKLCECIPKQVGKEFSKEEYMVFTNPNFKLTPQNSTRAGAFSLGLRTATMVCM